MRLSLGMGRSGDSPAGTDRPGLPRDLLTLAKPRIVALVLVATAFGYLMAPGARADWVYNDFAAGVAEAKKTDKPRLIILRCIP